MNRFTTGAFTLATMIVCELWLDRLDLSIAVLLIGAACTIAQPVRKSRQNGRRNGLQ